MTTPTRWKIREALGLVGASDAELVVIGGCGSSGTTLLRHRLDRHPAIFCGPETTLFLSRTTAVAELAPRFGFTPGEVAAWRSASRTRSEFIERFRTACLARSGKRIWAEKTPENIRSFPLIARRFPRARFVHVVRDGRDVACSLRQAGWMKLEKITGGADRRSPEVLEACARYWAERVRFGRRLAGAENYHEIRYEDLVERPEATLRALLVFLEAAWDPGVLAQEAAAAPAAGGLFATSVGRWRSELSMAEVEVLRPHMAPLLVELGYERTQGWRSRSGAPAAPVPRAAAPARPRRLAWWKTLRREALALWLGLRDPRFPWLSRLVAAAAALYLVAPFDLIPDRIPVLGLMDDAAAALLAGGLMMRIAPAVLRRELRYMASLRLSRRVWAV